MTIKLKDTLKFQEGFPPWVGDLITYNEGNALNQDEIEQHLSHEKKIHFFNFLHGRQIPVIEDNQPGVYVTDFLEWLNIPSPTRTYTPDGWTILKFTPRDGNSSYFKIFATWRYGDEEWRLSSGSDSAQDIKKDNGYWIWPQSSGSTYKLPIGEDSEGGYSFWQGGVLRNLIQKAETVIDVSIVTLDSLLKDDKSLSNSKGESDDI